MNDIAELERRIAYAMERIAKGIEGLDRAGAAQPLAEVAPAPIAPTVAVSEEEIATLRAELAEERLANAQLEERVRALRQKQEAQAQRSEAELTRLHDMMQHLDAELSRLRKANDQLQDSNAALRAANQAGVGEPHLINKSMMAELESMRAARQVDIAEVEAIKGALVPLLQDNAHDKEEAN